MRRHGTGGAGLRRGMTLVELTIVLIMIGLIAVVAAPTIDPGRTAPEQGARTLASAFLTAQRMAVVEQRNVIVRFDLDHEAVAIHVDANHDQAVDEGERIHRIPLGKRVRFGTAAPPRQGDSPPVTFDGRIDGMPAVTFSRNGAATEAGGIYLTSSSAGPRECRLVTLSRSTGRATVEHYTEGNGWQPLRRRQ